MKADSNIKKNYILNVLYQLLAIIIPIITTPYISRVLEPDGIGEYSYTLSIMSYFSMVAALGIATYGQLEIAKLRNQETERSTLFWEIVIARGIATIALLMGYFIAEPLFKANVLLYKVMCINLIACALDISWYFQGLEQFKLTVIRNACIKMICTVCIFLFVRKKEDLILYACILQGSSLLGNLLLWPYLRKSLVKVDLQSIKFYRHWRTSLMYFIPTVATSVYTVLDKSMIGIITKSSFENGYYEQAHKIEQIIIVVLTSFGTVTLPRIAYLWNEGNNTKIQSMINKTTMFVLLLAFPMMFGVIVTANRFIPIFLGAGYAPCVELLCIFSILIVVVGLDNTIGKQCLVATGRQRKFNLGVIAGACVNFVSNLVLIPIWGAKGAAIASVLAECIILFLFVIYSRDILDLLLLLKATIRYGLNGGLMGIACWSVGLLLPNSFIGLLVQVIVGVLVYLLVLIITKDPLLNNYMCRYKVFRK